jgi:hypothetical protein
VTRALRVCSKCGRAKEPSEFHRNPTAPDGLRRQCKTCVAGYARRRNASNPERKAASARAYRAANPAKVKEQTRRSALKRKYGITLEQYDEMLAAQGGRCAICRGDRPGARHGLFVVDHCHATGTARGLLCVNCNTAIGSLREDVAVMAAAVAYLRRWGQK